MVIVASIVIFVARFIMSQIPDNLRQVVMVVTFVVAFIPIALFVILLISFGFETVLNVFLSKEIPGQLRNLVGLSIVAIPVIYWLDSKLDPTRKIRLLTYTLYVVSIIAGLGTLYLLWLGGREVIGSTSFGELTIRDLGVSGIGTAPAIIALTLYSLLPLVRNTYAGLTNIDPAIIDAGRGMGMTPSQIFFQIELPLAFPVIMAGVRNAGISLVGIAAVATVIGAGALGDFIMLGVNSTSIDQILLGAIPAVALAVFLDAMLQILEGILTSPGIRQT
jgi:osmoprotectant transport system permease protein